MGDREERTSLLDSEPTFPPRRSPANEKDQQSRSEPQENEEKAEWAGIERARAGTVAMQRVVVGDVRKIRQDETEHDRDDRG
jgi:hypothetical protein